MTRLSAQKWLDEFAAKYKPQPDKVVIICPPALLAPLVSEEIEDLGNVSVGLQDFSPFSDGAHTGEEPPELASEYATYTIVGHSERRREFGETDELVAKKVASAIAHHVTPLVCVQGKDVPVPDGVPLIAFEPVFAIGSGTPDTPDNAEAVAKSLHDRYTQATIIYGGSVTAENVRSFTERELLRGVLVGGASLDSVAFAGIIKNA